MRHHDSLADDVYGMSRLDDRLFVVCRRTDRLLVFSCDPPYDRVADHCVGVPGSWMSEPCDLAIDRDRRAMFVGDRGGVWVMAVDGDGGIRVDQWIRTSYRPWSLSCRYVNRSRLV